jgi:hypothetical protein
MKRGNLLRLKREFVDGYELYTDYSMEYMDVPPGGEKITWFEPGELGLILNTKEMKYLDTVNTFHKILTPDGIGWIPSRFA